MAMAATAVAANFDLINRALMPLSRTENLFRRRKFSRPYNGDYNVFITVDGNVSFPRCSGMR